MVTLMGWDAGRSIESVCAPDHLQGAALADAIRSNGWGQLCFRSYSRDSFGRPQLCHDFYAPKPCFLRSLIRSLLWALLPLITRGLCVLLGGLESHGESSDNEGRIGGMADPKVSEYFRRPEMDSNRPGLRRSPSPQEYFGHFFEAASR
jgi:hypothetical protein